MEQHSRFSKGLRCRCLSGRWRHPVVLGGAEGLAAHNMIPWELLGHAGSQAPPRPVEQGLCSHQTPIGRHPTESGSTALGHGGQKGDFQSPFIFGFLTLKVEQSSLRAVQAAVCAFRSLMSHDRRSFS